MKTKVTLAAVDQSAWIPVNHKQANFAVGLAIDFAGTATAKVEVTMDDVQDPDVTPVAFDHAVLSGGSTKAYAGQETPVTAVRLNVTAWTSGDVDLYVNQSPV